MGSDKSRDSQAQDNETPQHRVELDAFQIGKYPVTVAEYALAVRAGAVRKPPKPFIYGVSWQSQLQCLDHPVVCVSWKDATAYVAWLSTVTGEPGWRLPNEAEWEKAARWDTKRGVGQIYPWGDSFDKVRCNTSESGVKTTTSVGSYPESDPLRSGASPCGAEDMAGNVWEWTNSVDKPYPYSENDGRYVQQYVDKAFLLNTILRGGSWGYKPWTARAAHRMHNQPDYACFDFGFRIVHVP